MEDNSTIEERQEQDKQALVEALKEMPIIQVACKRAGVSRATYYRWRNEDKNFLTESNEAIAHGIDFINDMSESQLITLIKEKKMPAISMWLRNNNSRYGAKIQEHVLKTLIDEIDPNDARYPHQQKIKKVAEEYEEQLRNTIVEEIQKI
ncbi:MAG: hypothetical protein A2365_02025 [Candidatus Nealsonbacteria bacterium RIFOXYB1_FULL_40_15]|uniref:Homeodomain phBC6A51-type domain-containing protein n=2 Tax=Candidatus Nealsoniibacteriota TaxID=1817911 RepID=A0A1G2ER37_9BACT|nr:MAG: hypothetical protein A2365_02025 [Candidatus Nealsonbacteria bacterium RIFOXYB1_FULL_40_15]OGZ28219.1 MAG: hypothetical protein A2427_02600 [Candidatus Nealsonbacteria bacterium RIFOXYC1_FULL_40_7]OGZ28985.1 MAG: hypothetical protein A2562_01755 [Candidatus Nealsonbacteria bacterium RIFOXYD1_FULL_39_11]